MGHGDCFSRDAMNPCASPPRPLLLLRRRASPPPSHTHCCATRSCTRFAYGDVETVPAGDAPGPPLWSIRYRRFYRLISESRKMSAESRDLPSTQSCEQRCSPARRYVGTFARDRPRRTHVDGRGGTFARDCPRVCGTHVMHVEPRTAMTKRDLGSI